MQKVLQTTELRFEYDVVQARQRAREIAGLLGFDHNEQIRLATATSEIARNAFRYARQGKVEFSLKSEPAPEFVVTVTDKGPGIANLDEILGGGYRSRTGLGKGIIGTKRLMDEFVIESNPGGTRVVLGKHLSKTAPRITTQFLQSVTNKVIQKQPDSIYQELEQQNQELLKTLAELRSRQDELVQLNRELEDTNRGVVALYAELDERADALRRISDAKTTFISNMSHEFRTPLNSVLSLSRMLLNKSDGDLTLEQEKQVKYIQQATEELYEMVNDLLDLAKVEAGKSEVKARDFEIADLFSALRGMLKPLLQDSTIALVFEDPRELPTMHTDEGKVSQILRNFISNALKFTPRGEVRVTASLGAEDSIILSVADTGIGIAKEDQARIFDEFAQVDNPIQRKVRGTGLGLALTRNLAQALGGRVTLESEPGLGSVFSVVLPIIFPGTDKETLQPVAPSIESQRIPILMVEDNLETAFLVRKFLANTEFQTIGARTFDEAKKMLPQFRPALVMLDVLLQGESSWPLIDELKSQYGEAKVPVLAVSITSQAETALKKGVDAFLQKPFDRDGLLKEIRRLTHQSAHKLLLIDDDEVSRYLLRGLIPSRRFDIYEAHSGTEGLRIAQEEQPQAIILDLVMPDMTGFEVLERLKVDVRTSAIPTIIHSSRQLSDQERELLNQPEVYLFPKSNMQDAKAADLFKAVLQSAGLIPDHTTEGQRV